MKQKNRIAWTALALCLCIGWIVTGTWADSSNDSVSNDPGQNPNVIIVDGKKVLLPDEQKPAQTDVKPAPSGKGALSDERQRYLDELAAKAAATAALLDESPDDFDGADPRGGGLGACCDTSTGACTLRDQPSCAAVGGLFQGVGTACTPDNPCAQPITCDLGVPFSHVSQFPPHPQFDPFAFFISDVDASSIAAQGFNSTGGEITRIRWWGIELSGATNCTRANNNFNITFFADAGILGSQPTTATPEIVAQYSNLTAQRRRAQSYAFDGTQMSYNGQLLWEYTVVLPQRTVLLNGWVAIQATADGTPCNFRWLSAAFGPGHLEVNGQPVNDPSGQIQDVTLCLGGDASSVQGTCCDDSVQGGNCQENVESIFCTDFGGGDHRFRVDTTCATLTPPCGSVTGSCCVGAACSITTAPDCAQQGGSFISFEDCEPNVCVGACCIGTGECLEITEDDCFGQGGQFFGNGTLCSQTACPGTGRCCFNQGQDCEVRTQSACAQIAGSRWDAGLTCSSPCPIPPVNDLCTGAIPITCGETITVDTTIATVDPSDPTFPCRVGGATQGTATIWFTFVPTTSSATIRTCGSLGPDSMLQVFDGSCGAFGPPLACNDDSCGLLSSLCVSNLIVGNTYYIELAGWGAASPGVYSLEVVCPGITCASTGSCCLPSGACSVITEPACLLAGGDYNGDSTTCGTLGACCMDEESCVLSNQQCCQAAGGAFLGEGTNCGDAAGDPIEFSASPNQGIPDASPTGIVSTINVPASFTVGDVNVKLSITHTWVGDLCVELEHSGITVPLIQRMGADTGVPCHTGTPFGCASDNLVNIVLDDAGTGGPIESQCVLNLTSPPNYTPFSPLSAFNGSLSNGDWNLRVIDNAGGDLGTFVSWSVILDGVGFNPCDTEPGACCFSEGTGDCQLLNAVDCVLAGGRFTSGGTSCTGDVCVPRGACCDIVTGGCEQLTEESCNAIPTGNFLGDFSSCALCPVITGSCCNADGTCTANTTHNPCVAGGGSFTPGGTCGTVGACCLEDTSCFLTTEACCQFGGGAYLGNDTNCGESAGDPTEYTASPNTPFGPATGFANLSVPDSFTIGDVNIHLNITHTWVGDIVIDIEHNGTTVRIIEGPGVEAAPPFGCAEDNYNNIILDDEGTGGPIENQCVANLTSPPSYTPNNPLSAFDGLDAAGIWNISLIDTFPGEDDGVLISWTVEIDGIGFNPCDTEPGACCFSEGIGDCQLLNAIDCAVAGGRFQGGGTACAGDICVPRGACCNTFDGSCERVTQAQCAAMPNGSYLGNFTSCGQCPIILGACCLPDMSCVPDIRVTQCDQLGGAFLPETGCGDAAGDPTTYADSPNAPINDLQNTTVTTNVPDSFTIGDVDVFIDITHTFLADLDIDVIHGGTTVRIMQDQCGANDNMQITFDDEGTAIVCATPTVGTYIPFSPLSAFDGMNAFGDWTLNVFDDAGADQGTLVAWSVIIDGIGINPCDTEPGACCFSEGIGDCQLLNAVDCSTQGGRFQGGGTACAGDICVPRGACCNTVTGSCQQLTQAQCAASPNGNYLGNFTPCSGCPVVVGSCCLPNLSCITNTQFAPCTSQGGTFNPGGNCDVVGPCCLSDGTCNIATQVCCEAAGGAYLGDGLNCGEAAGNPSTYTDNPNAPINDNQNTTVNINVADGFTIGDVNVFLDITHTFLADLDIDVIHDGTTVRIMQDQCGANDNMQITFDDEGVPIVCATPTVGTYIPFSPLAAFDGMNAGGQWTLNVFDDAGADQGFLVSWSMIIDGVGVNPCDTDPGACCFSETVADCQLLDAVACASAGGRFQGGGTACAGDICEIRGACCDPTTGACTQLSQAACTASGGNWLGGFTNCSQCPIVIGACCLPTGGCTTGVQFNACNSQGGAFLPNQNCGDSAGDPTTYSASPNQAIPDNSLTGVSSTINVPDSYTVGDVNVRLNVTHTWVGDLCISLEHGGTTARLIDRMGADTGAACHNGTPFGCAQDNLVNIVLDDEGTVTIEGACALNLTSPPNYIPNEALSAFDGMNSSGAWTLTVIDNAGGDFGTFVSWDLILDEPGVNPCDTTPGACCVGEADTDCSLQTVVDCAALQGRYQGPGSTCTPGICVIRGACCDTVLGTCEQLTPAQCVGGNLVYQGNFTNCSTANCPQSTGACCLASGGCDNGRTFAQCTSSGGSWEGPNSTCAVVVGACCLGGDECVLTSASCCASIDGDYAGAGTNCGGPSGNPTTYSQSPNATIPDNNPTGITRTINVPDSFPIADVDVSVQINHIFVGQLIIRVTHNGVTRTIVDQIGRPAIDNFGCPQTNLNIRLDDEGTGGAVENACSGAFGTPFPTSPPNFIPNQLLNSFDGMDAAGDWSITVIDAAGGGVGTLVSWSLHIDGFGGGACSSTTDCSTCPGDTNGDGVLNGADVRSFSDCVLGLGGDCPCGDMNNDGGVSMDDVPGFVNTLLQGTGSCGQVPVCTTCMGDGNGDGYIDGEDCQAFVTCILATPGGCPCADMNNSGSVDMGDVEAYINAMLSSGPCP